MTYHIYTDGAASPNPGTGGWAFAVVVNDKIVYKESGKEENTTNQRMEMKAVAAACEFISTVRRTHGFVMDDFIIYTDSAYIFNCFSAKWYVNWERNGWRNSKKEPVANRDLWEEIVPFFENVGFKKVKGHDGNEYNEIVDKLAVAARSNK